MMNKPLLPILLLCLPVLLMAQNADELKAAQAAKKDSIVAIQGRVDAIQAEIDALPGWKVGALGTIGVDISEFSNWYAQGSPNNSAGNIGFTVNAYANQQEEKFFWRNSLNLNFKWIKFDDKDDPNDEEGYRESIDVFNLTTLYGRKISNTFAISGLAEYRTTILSNFNDPGYLDVGVGGTWTPVTDLVVVIHPANYNFVFSDEDDIFESSFGVKIVADYIKTFGKAKIKSNISSFISYESGNLSSWTWTNTFAYTLWKGIGVGFDFGLRNNKQEALNYEINTLGNVGSTFDSIDNDLQTYWTLGLSYSF